MKIIIKLAKTYNKELRDTAGALKPCPYCNTQHFIEFPLLNILRKGTVEAIKEKEFADVIKMY